MATFYEETQQCPYRPCEFRGYQRELQHHILTCNHQIIYHLVDVVAPLENEMDFHLSLTRIKDQQIKNLKTKIESLKRENLNLRLQLVKLYTQLLDKEHQYDKLQKYNLQEINPLKETLEDVKYSIEESGTVNNDNMHGQEEATGTTSISRAGLSLVTFDGTLVWKITDVARRQEDAVNGKETSFYSNPFYTKRHGYKMCSRIYLNGNGVAQGTAISLFFVIMRGEDDVLLPWPFQHKVTLMLIDQDNVEHVVDTLQPDLNSSSFQRPTARMNIAIGCPMFCPFIKLANHSYICDDTMFIKVIVDAI